MYIDIRSIFSEILGENFSLVSDFNIHFLENRQTSFEQIHRIYKWLSKKGFSPQKIAQNSSLLGHSIPNLNAKWEYLTKIGISGIFLAKAPKVFSIGLSALKVKINFLRSKGILPKSLTASNINILTCDHQKLARRWDSLEKLGIHLKLLSENMDSFAKKMRLFKLDVLNLKRLDSIGINEYRSYFIHSPASHLAKIIFCMEYGINSRYLQSYLRKGWKTFFLSLDKAITSEEVTLLQKRAQSFKARYDEWMGHYKRHARNFFLRRGRRLIQKI